MRVPLVRWPSERHALSGEVQGLGPSVDGTRAPDLGSDGGPGDGARRHHGGGARDRDRTFHHPARPQGVGIAPARRTATDSAARRRPQENAGKRSDAADRSRRVGGADRGGPSAVAAALDVEERAAFGGGPPSHGPRGQPATGGRTARGGGLQSAGQPQDPRRLEPPGPRRAVPVHQPAGAAVPSGHTARHLRRYEEEGTGRRLQKRGATVAAPRAAYARPGA